MAYTEVQRALAVDLVKRNSGKLDTATLAAIRKVLGLKRLSDQTVRNWLKESGSPKNLPEQKSADPALPAEVSNQALIPTPNDIQEMAAEALDKMFESTARLYLAQSQKADVIGATKGKDAVIAAATAYDKVRLARGLPTEIVKVLPDLLVAIQERGLSASAVFASLLEELSANRE